MSFELSYLVGPLVGGVIGYITNDVAIRMLFRPHQPKYIFGMHVPFTPGIIPKEKYRIAQAVGETISDNLMNQEVLEKNLLSKEMIGKIVGTIDKFISQQQHNPETLESFLSHYLTRRELQSMRESAEGDLAKILYKKLNDESVGTKISHKIIERVMVKMQSGLTGIVGNTLGELLKDKQEQTAQLKQTAIGLYRTIISERLPRILNALNISKIIENRINEMDMNDTERIVHQVMDKELKAVIWFGALLGFIIGIINTIF